MTPSNLATVAAPPPLSELLNDRAFINEAYAFIPCGAHRHIVTSHFQFWKNTWAWLLFRPVTGTARTLCESAAV
jgi:glyoxylate utilization-related uncharacterized protein